MIESSVKSRAGVEDLEIETKENTISVDVYSIYLLETNLYGVVELKRLKKLINP